MNNRTERCSFCRELFDSTECPDLNTPKFNCCYSCWCLIIDYLLQRDFTILDGTVLDKMEKLQRLHRAIVRWLEIKDTSYNLDLPIGAETNLGELDWQAEKEVRAALNELKN